MSKKTVSQNNDGVTRSTQAVRSASQPNVERRWFGSAAIVLATLAVYFLAPTTASAQQAEPSQQTGLRVAVLDVDFILQNLPEIKAHASKTQGELKRDQAKRQQQRDELKQAVEQLKTLKVGTAEYARQEEHVADLDSKLRFRKGHRHHELSDADAKMIHDSYQRISAAVEAIATRQNIALVVQFDSKGMNSEQSDSVDRGILSDVVYHDSTINITDIVMRHLEQQSKTSQAASDGPKSPNVHP